MSGYQKAQVDQLGVVDKNDHVAIKINVSRLGKTTPVDQDETKWMLLTLRQWEKIREVLRG